ncbi:hypothetical protein BD309DRAFT_870191, partial [Dichomitus squalens]
VRRVPSLLLDGQLSWSILTTGPYIEVRNTCVQNLLGRFKRSEGNTFVSTAQIGRGHSPLITLKDLGFFALHTLDNRNAMSAQEFEIESE